MTEERYERATEDGLYRVTVEPERTYGFLSTLHSPHGIIFQGHHSTFEVAKMYADWYIDTRVPLIIACGMHPHASGAIIQAYYECGKKGADILAIFGSLVSKWPGITLAEIARVLAAHKLPTTWRLEGSKLVFANGRILYT